MPSPPNKPTLPQVTGQATSQLSELSFLSFVILRTVKTVWFSTLLEAELRKGNHQYRHCTATTLATCIAALEADPPTHVFVVFDDAVDNIDYTVDDIDDAVDGIEDTTPREIKPLDTVTKSSILEFCADRKIHCTFFSNGNFYRHDERNCFYDSGFKEDAEPNFELHPISRTTYDFQQYLARKHEKDALVLRLRSPIWDNFNGFLDKFERARNKHNSWSVLHDVLPAAVFLARHEVTGTFNFTNPGTTTSYNALVLLRDEFNPKMSFTMPPDINPKDAKAVYRSDCKLDMTKLQDALKIRGYPDIPGIEEALRNCCKRMKSSKIGP